MKKFLFLFLFCLKSSLVSGQVFSIQTLNVYNPLHLEGIPFRADLFLDFLEESHSDIHIFQEVFSVETLENIKRVSHNKGMEGIFYDDFTKNQKRSGLVTLLTGDIYKAELHPFPLVSFYDKFRDIFGRNKGFGVAYVKHSKLPDKPFWLVNIHLHNLSQYVRLKQISHYFNWFLKAKAFQTPVISSGDFNFEPDSLEFRMMRDLFLFEEPQTYLGLNYKCTLCNENNQFMSYFLSRMMFMNYERTVDYIFFKSSLDVELAPKKFKVFPKKYKGEPLSDHYGVNVDIEFKDRSHFRKVSGIDIQQRIQYFSETLEELSDYFDEDEPEQEFIKSLELQLEDFNSPLIQHLSSH